MNRYFLGVDIGSSKTHALISDEAGNALGFGGCGAGNHEVVGYAGLEKAFQESTCQALMMAGLEIGQIAGAGFGVAGYDWPSERLPTLQAIQSLGLECPVEAVNDVDIGLIAGAEEGWGIVIDSGSGNNVRGRAADGRSAGITGNGGRFGEFGGSRDLVDRALVAIAHEWSGRGPATALTPAFIHAAGAQDIDDFLEGLVLEKYSLKSQLAPLVFQVAHQGDQVAQEVIAWNSRELGYSAVGVIRKLGLQKFTFDVVLIGSMFNGGPLAIDPMKQVILDEAPNACFVRLSCSPAVGGVLLGMHVAGLAQIGAAQRLIRARLMETSSRLI